MKLIKVRALAFVTGVCFLAVLCQGQQVPNTLHIAVGVRALSGEPVPDLRASNFHVDADGLPLAVQLTPVPASTCLLIINAAASGYTTLAQQRDLLALVVRSLDRSSYQPAALGPHGEFVKFQPTKEALLPAFDSSRVATQGDGAALDALTSCHGRRAALYLTGPRGKAPVDLVRALVAAGASIYQVGGDTNQNYASSDGEAGSTTPYFASASSGGGSLAPASAEAPTSPIAQPWESFPVRAVSDVDVESTLQNAIQRLQRGRDGFYDLFVQFSPGVARLEIAVKAKQSVQLNAYIFAATSPQVPALRFAPAKGR